MANQNNSTDVSGEDYASVPPRATFLALIILLSLVANVLLISAMWHTRKVVQNVQNFAIINMSAVCLFDCVFNMAVVFGSLSVGTWNFDDALCRCHLFAMTVVVIQTILLLTLLTIDRYLAVKLLHKYDLMLSPLYVPYIITTFMHQYHFSRELDFVIDYPSSVDAAFMWMRFSYSASFPITTYVWRKELWQTTKECVICRRSNSVVDIESKAKQGSRTTAVAENSSKIPSRMKDREQKEEPLTILSFNVPVLFATSEGIHIETQHSDVSDTELFYAEILDTAKSTQKQRLKGRRLDVGDPEADDLPMSLNTSDYDSSTEEDPPFRTVSAGQVNGTLDSSKSATAIDIKKDQKQDILSQQKSSTVFTLNGNDSGLDLSDTPGSSTEKQLQKLVEKSRTRASTEASPSSSQIDGDGISNDMEQECCKNCDCMLRHKSEHCPQTLQQKPIKLKPLEKSKRSRSRKEIQKKNKEAVIASNRACDKTAGQNETVLPSEQSKHQLETECEIENSQKKSVVESKRSSGTARGHKRTMTSDSQKPLMDSNSSQS
ncbi:hypothetical protein C0Q70_08849 [Pomacea canaliculata]|uniref:G-protein coupled receptors family 1 profile domain-containing protein n=1 Tax=Pomacea canaliculata TaxID=400727 RepID=A0A2T7P847_POMCA|nr:hypothetical protein C0Q70_08849 [Pomacea canaliculata]